MESKSDNELIAAFMGSEPYNDGRYGILWPDPTNDNKVGFGLKYDTSWDWLHHVIDKIGNLWDLNEIGTESEKVLRLPVSTHIQEVNKAVVKFIHWYNEQTKQV